MKTSQLITVLVLFIAGGFSMDLSAQEALKALVKKCENMENVNVSIVRNKDKTTRKVSQVMTGVSFSNNEALVKEILAAFNQDKDMADQEIEDRSNGRVKSLYYSFGSTSYSFSEDGNGGGSLSVIKNGDE